MERRTRTAARLTEREECLHKVATGTVTVPSIGKGGVVGEGFGCTCTPLANARKHAQIAFDRTLRHIIAVGGRGDIIPALTLRHVGVKVG